MYSWNWWTNLGENSGQALHWKVSRGLICLGTGSPKYYMRRTKWMAIKIPKIFFWNCTPPKESHVGTWKSSTHWLHLVSLPCYWASWSQFCEYVVWQKSFHSSIPTGSSGIIYLINHSAQEEEIARSIQNGGRNKKCL